MKLCIILAVLVAIVAAEINDPCGPHGHLKPCDSACNVVPTCKNPHPPVIEGPRICTKNCVPRCICNEKYILDEVKNICVKPEECNKNDETC